MLLAAFANNIRDTSHALLDGHNASAYRNTLAVWQSNEGALNAPPTEIALNNNSGAGNQLGIGLTAYLIC